MSKTAITSPELAPPVGPFSRQSKSMVSSSSADRSAKTRPLARWSRGHCAETERVFQNLSAVLKGGQQEF